MEAKDNCPRKGARYGTKSWTKSCSFRLEDPVGNSSPQAHTEKQISCFSIISHDLSVIEQYAIGF